MSPPAESPVPRREPRAPAVKQTPPGHANPRADRPAFGRGLGRVLAAAVAVVVATGFLAVRFVAGPGGSGGLPLAGAGESGQSRSAVTTPLGRDMAFPPQRPGVLRPVTGDAADGLLLRSSTTESPAPLAPPAGLPGASAPAEAPRFALPPLDWPGGPSKPR